MAATGAEVWQNAVVVEHHRIADDIARIVVEVARPTRVEPGTHLDVRVQLPDGTFDTRSYSIVEGTGGGRRVALSVFRTATSRGGSAFMHSLTVGDRLEVTQPMQNFPLRVGARRYLLIAGGIGVTALVGMAGTLHRLGADYEIVYVGRSRSAMAYLAELVSAHGDRLRVHVDDEGSALSVPTLLDTVDATTEVYMCGPTRLMDAVRRGFEQVGLPMANLRYETFGNSGWFAAKEFEVSVPRLGISSVVQPGETMLEALERAGVDMMFDCRKGECGLCEVRILGLTGVVDHRDVFYSRRQREASARMCCCVSRVVGPQDHSPDDDPAPTGPGPARPLVVVDVS